MAVSAFRRCPSPPRGMFQDELSLLGRFYLLPMGLASGEAGAAAIIGGHGWPVAGSGLAFTQAGLILREREAHWLSVLPFAELQSWSEGEGDDVARHMGRLVRRIGAERASWAGLSLEHPRIMGIVNATPDSFSDGGDTFEADRAVARALALVEAGADIIDVGGESTRPGSLPVSAEDEIARTRPVVRALAERGICVSIDTRHAPVMAAALEAGARIINDVTALEGDADSLRVAASSDAALCLMHMQGAPQTMQADPRYDCAPLDVYDYLAERVAACTTAGIDIGRIAVDPGIGFGKTVDHNLQILAALALYHGLGCPILLGASRKTFIGKLSRGEEPKQRGAGTVAAHLAGLDAGVQIIRVHDVAEAAQALAVWRGIHAV